jgi:hypothetical protein
MRRDSDVFYREEQEHTGQDKKKRKDKQSKPRKNDKKENFFIGHETHEKFQITFISQGVETVKEGQERKNQEHHTGEIHGN